MTGRTIYLLRYMTLVGIATAVAGCSNPAGNLPTSPSEAPATLADHGGTGGNARYYGATVTEGSSVGPGTLSTFAIKIENCNGSGTCDNSHVTFNTQKIGHATIKIPDAFSGLTILGVTNNQPTDAWQRDTFSDSTGSYIRLWAPAGNKRLEPGQSVTVRFSATAPCEGDQYIWETGAYQAPDVTDEDTEY